MAAQHVGHHLPDPAKADDDRMAILARRRRGRATVVQPAIDLPRQPPPNPRQQRRHGQPDGGDDLPELRGGGADQRCPGGGGEHDQRGFRRAGQQDPRLGRRARARTRQPHQRGGDSRLDQQHPRGGDQDRQGLSGQHGKVDPHPDGEQEDAERQAFKGPGHRGDLAMIFGLGDQQPGDQSADDRRQPRARRRQRGGDDDKQAGGQEQFGAFGARRLGEQARQHQPPDDQQHDYHPARPRQRVDQRDQPMMRVRGQSAEQEDDRHQRQILEQQHGQRGAADRRAGARDRQHQSGR